MHGSKKGAGRRLAMRAAGALLLVQPAHAAADVGTALLPHRATYTLSRSAASRDAQIVSVEGRMQVTFEASCDGWRIEQSLWLRLYSPDGLVADSLAVLSAWETHDGRRYWFNTHAYEDGRLDEVIRGSARAAEPGAEVKLRITEPAAEPRTLPAGTIFPVAHWNALLAGIETGESAVSRIVFDGSTLESPYEISAFVGNPVAPEPAIAEHASRAWPVRMGYFRPGAVDPAPEFELSVSMHEGGISGTMVYDYGDLEIDVELGELELLELPVDCEE